MSGLSAWADDTARNKWCAKDDTDKAKGTVLSIQRTHEVKRYTEWKSKNEKKQKRDKSNAKGKPMKVIKRNVFAQKKDMHILLKS